MTRAPLFEDLLSLCGVDGPGPLAPVAPRLVSLPCAGEGSSVIITPGATKHGVMPEEIEHAYHHALIVHEEDEGVVMIVDPARDGTLIELGYLVSDDGTVVVIHAMRPARPKFLR